MGLSFHGRRRPSTPATLRARPLLPREIMTTRIVSTGVSSGNVVRGAIVGLVGGLLAAGVMSVAHRILSDLDPKAEAPSPKPEDPTVKVARAATGLAGYMLAEH